MGSVPVLLDRYYYSRSDFTDGTTEFHRMCSRNIGAGSRILEIGAGPTNRTSAHLAGIGMVTGVDVSPEVLQNEALSTAYVYNGSCLPFSDNDFDACVADYVLEHIRNPSEHFAEVARVLKPGGTYCFRTPNLWHYVSFMSFILPHSFHRGLANRLRGLGNDAHEPWPTVYAANSPGAIRKHCKAAGLEVVQLRMVEKEPSYGHLSVLMFYTMMCYERVVNAWPALDGLRINIFGMVRKPDSGAPAAERRCTS
jgi:SAM-dependent methyltransferase